MKISRELRYAGFTIVEAMIIIGVLGILATITAFGFNGVTTWSQNNTRAGEVQQWAGSFDVYKGKYASYPAMPAGVADGTYGPYCLGDFPATTPANKCGELANGLKRYDATGASTSGAAATTIRTELAKVGNVPSNNASVANKTYIGPYITFNQVTVAGTVTLTARFYAIIQGSSCPSTEMVVDATATLPGAGVSGIVNCRLDRTLVYTP